MHPKIPIEDSHGRNDDVAVLLRDLSNPPRGVVAWQDDEAQADALAVIARFGVDLVRRGFEHNLDRVRRGRFNAKHSFRGAVIRFCEDAQAGRPWVDDQRAAAANAARQRAEAEGEERRRAAAKQREAEQLAQAEANDELLWSQLSDEQRDELHRAVVEKFPPLGRLAAEGPTVRRQMVREFRLRTAAG